MELPLVERDHALRALDEALRASCAGTGRLVLIHGEAGIGKSTVVEHFERAHRDRRFLRGFCEALATPRSLGPIFDFEPELPRELRDALRADGDRRSDFYRGLLAELGGGDKTGVLVLEDVHWADGATLELIRFIGRRIRTHRALAILTARDDPASAATLAAAVGDISTASVTRVHLQALSEAGVRTLAQGHGWDSAALHQATGGNPFFVTEVLRGGARGREVPASVRDALHVRLAQLSQGARAFAHRVSIFPRHALLDELALLGEFEVEAADECIAAGLLVLQDGAIRFRHELARTFVEESMLPARRLVLHKRLLHCLAERPTGSVPLARLAHHAQHAGEIAEILRWAPAAAAEAAARGSRREAAAHCEAALAHASHMPAAEHARLLEALGDSQFELNELQHAAASYARASVMFGEAGALSQQAQCLAKQAMPLVRLLRNRDADEVATAAMRIAQSSGETQVLGQAFATESYLRMLNRDYREAIDAGARAIQLADERGDRALLASGYKTSGAALIFLDYPAGCAMLERSLAIAHELPDGGSAAADAWLMLGTASGELYEFAQAERFMEEGIAFAHSRDLDRQALYMEAWQAMCDMYVGRWTSAGERALAVLAAEKQPSTCRLVALVTLGRLRTRRGDPGAAEVLDEALDLGMRSGTLQRLGPACVARAEAAWLRGDLPAVRAEAARAWDLATSKGQPWIVGELAYWRHAAGDTPDELSGCAEPFRAEIEGDSRRAAELWGRRGCPYEEARALAAGDEQAQVRALKALDAMAAQPLAAVVRARMRACGHAAVPRGPVASTRRNAAGLTRREVEVLQLLARDLRSQEIASRLSRSVRTVDHHLESLYSKLEVSGRAQAVERARELGLLDSK